MLQFFVYNRCCAVFSHRQLCYFYVVQQQKTFTLVKTIMTAGRRNEMIPPLIRYTLFIFCQTTPQTEPCFPVYTAKPSMIGSGAEISITEAQEAASVSIITNC